MPDFLGAAIVHPWRGVQSPSGRLELGSGSGIFFGAGAGAGKRLCANRVFDRKFPNNLLVYDFILKKLSKIHFFARRGRRANAHHKDGKSPRKKDQAIEEKSPHQKLKMQRTKQVYNIRK
jgi:hypothetical protein